MKEIYKISLQKFCKIAGKENAAKWALKKYLQSLDELLKKNCYNCSLIEQIKKSLLRKVYTKALYIKLPKWERLVSKVKSELKKIAKLNTIDGTLGGSVEHIEVIPAKNGMDEIEINIKDEPEFHSPHVHIVYGIKECTILLSEPKEIYEGDEIPKKVLKVVVKSIKKHYKKILKRYHEKNPPHWKTKNS